MNKPTTIKIELQDDDYNPLEVEYGESSSSWEGGGDIYSAVIGVIALATKDKYMQNKWDRLEPDDRKHLGKIIKNAFKSTKDQVKYFMDNFYDKPEKEKNWFIVAPDDDEIKLDAPDYDIEEVI